MNAPSALQTMPISMILPASTLIVLPAICMLEEDTELLLSVMLPIVTSIDALPELYTQM